jgi:hypothetical protein
MAVSNNPVHRRRCRRTRWTGGTWRRCVWARWIGGRRRGCVWARWAGGTWRGCVWARWTGGRRRGCVWARWTGGRRRRYRRARCTGGTRRRWTASDQEKSDCREANHCLHYMAAAHRFCSFLEAIAHDDGIPSAFRLTSQIGQQCAPHPTADGPTAIMKQKPTLSFREDRP